MENLSSNNIQKKYAVITGASSGIGMEFAKQLSNKGYPLVLIARREDRLKALTEQVNTECKIITADLSEIEECKRVSKAIENIEVEIFINNAGFGDCGKFIESSVEKELDMIQVNISAFHFFTKQILKKMQENDRGYILNVASSAGLLPAGPFMSTYYATKAYVASLTRGVAEELNQSSSNVYIGCLCPGPVNTEFNDVANVEFALKGISAEYCVEYTLTQMKKKKVVIVPTMQLKLATVFGRLIPSKLCIKITAHQQKKKMQPY